MSVEIDNKLCKCVCGVMTIKSDECKEWWIVLCYDSCREWWVVLCMDDW